MRRFLIFCGDYGSRVILQALYFVFVSRTLGAEGLGVFASLTAFTTLAACFSGLGSEQIMVTRSSSDRFNLAEEFGITIWSTVVTFPVLLVLTVSVASSLLHGSVSFVAMVSVVAAELLFTRMIAVAASLFYIKHMIVNQFIVNMSLYAIRTAVAGYFYYTLGRPILINEWCFFYASASCLAGLGSFIMVCCIVTKPVVTLSLGNPKLGVLYSLEYASLAGFRDLDKPIVNGAIGPGAAGLYAAAFRIVDTSSVPIRAYLQSSYLRYFSLIKVSQYDAYLFAIRSVSIVSAISLFIAIVLVCAAPYIHILLGQSYTSAGPVIVYMCLYPMLLGISAVGADLLRAMGKQKARLGTLIFTYLSYVPVIYLGSSYYGVEGAALARMLTQFIALLSTWLVIFSAIRGKP